MANALSSFCRLRAIEAARKPRSPQDLENTPWSRGDSSPASLCGHYMKGLSIPGGLRNFPLSYIETFEITLSPALSLGIGGTEGRVSGKGRCEP